MAGYCPNCGASLVSGASFCANCGTKLEQQPQPMYPPQQTQSRTGGLWYQNYYRIRKKTLTVGNKYWIEDYNSNILGFSKQKLFKLKEDIRIYTDESETQELFSIKQKQIMDAWGNFAVVDSNNNPLGYIKREWLSSAFAKDTYEIFNTDKQLIGTITEKSAGQALARKYLPGGGLIPEKMTLELNGVHIAEIKDRKSVV